MKKTIEIKKSEINALKKLSTDFRTLVVCGTSGRYRKQCETRLRYLTSLLKRITCLIAILFTFLLLPCEAKYKVTWKEDHPEKITLATDSMDWPFETVKMEQIFDTPLEAQQFKSKLPVYAMDVHCELVRDSDTTGN